MGRYVFRLPDVGEGTAEAEIVAWHVAVGDRIEEDQPLVDVTTDKAVVEIAAPVAGRVVSLNGAAGEMIAVGSDLVVLDVEGEGNATAGQTPSAAAASPTLAADDVAPEEATQTIPAEAKRETLSPPAAPTSTAAGDRSEGQRAVSAFPAASTTRTPGEKPVAAPAVRGRARELGIELQFVPGTGPGGRITHADLDAYIVRGTNVAGQGRAVMSPKDGVEEHPLIGVRRKIAERMQEAKRRIPHFSYIEEVDMTALESLRLQLNAKYAQRPKLTLLPFVMRALVTTLPEHPEINARFDDDKGVVHRYQGVHIGIATQTPNGLVVPVVRHAEALDLWGCADEIVRLASAARENRATREQLAGSTITITSLGPIGGVATTPVINYPEVAIIGINKLVERPVVQGGQIVVRRMMNLSCSFDHRVVDGWNAAEFVQKLKGCLEQPAMLFID